MQPTIQLNEKKSGIYDDIGIHIGIHWLALWADNPPIRIAFANFKSFRSFCGQNGFTIDTPIKFILEKRQERMK